MEEALKYKGMGILKDNIRKIMGINTDNLRMRKEYINIVVLFLLKRENNVRLGQINI